MSDNGATAFPTQLAVTCGFCGETNDVTWFCKWCAGSLCSTCKISHSTIPMFKNHTVVPRTNDVLRLHGPSGIAEQCQIHPEKDISTYCNECRVPCCVTCQIINHKRHDISTIEDKYLSAEQRLNDTAKKLEKGVMTTLDSMADKTKNDRSEKRVQINRVREEINIHRKFLKQAVDESCDGLLETFDQYEMEFDNFIDRIDSQKRKVRKSIEEINKIIQKGDLSMIKYSPPNKEYMIPELPTPRLTTCIPIFSPNRDILTIIKNKLGTIEWTDNPSHPRTFDPSTISINKVISFMSRNRVTSIITADNNTAWVMDSDRDIMFLYEGNGNIVRSLTVKSKISIGNMAIKKSKEMIVTCFDKNVRRVSVSGEISTLIDTSPFRPYGVCLTDSEDIVVCMREQNERDHVAVYSSDTGRKLREIRGIDCQGKQNITYPHRVVCFLKYLCVVNANLTNNVVCVDERGDLRWTYDGEEAKLAESFYPRGISVDKYNNLLVTDRNNKCVHYIDKEGRLINIILTQEQTGLTGHGRSVLTIH